MAMIPDGSKRNIVFCGEIGMGKSSIINLLLNSDSFAAVSNDSRPCTQVPACYQTTLGSTVYSLWDTRGLGEGRGFFQALFGRSSEKELKKFLKERHRNNELDLLVYCVRGSRATTASVRYYDSICTLTRRLAAPVVLVVTFLEKEKNMEAWWNTNSSSLEKLGMEFDDHVCITTLPEHPRLAESKERLVDLIARVRHWEVEHSGSYFGSPVQKRTPSPPPSNGGVSGLFKVTDRSSIVDGVIKRRPISHLGSSSAVPSPRNSSYYTAESPRESIPPSPTVVPPTPRSAIPFANLLQNNDHLGVSDTSQSTSEETSSMRSSLPSGCGASPHSSHTSYSDVYLQPTEENEDHFSELPFRHSTVRRKNSYATRRGAFGDVWECELISGESSQMVAVKAVKTNTSDDIDPRSCEKKLRRELKIWGKLRHKNVVPLLGVVPGFGPLPSMVSPWFCNGSLSHYLAHHKKLNLSEKHQLLNGIAAGLCYLHRQEVIHGDLHSDNVLIDENGTACLTDFGLSLIKDFVGTSYVKSSICGGVQFADPALVQRVVRSHNAVFYPTKPCDVYSFGGLMLHVLSGKKPYDEIQPSTAIFLEVMKGERPQIPAHDKHITQRHKLVIEMCWDPEEPKRPSADSLVKKFEL